MVNLIQFRQIVQDGVHYKCTRFLLAKRVYQASSCINISVGKICIYSDDSHLSCLFTEITLYNNEQTQGKSTGVGKGLDKSQPEFEHLNLSRFWLKPDSYLLLDFLMFILGSF